MKAMRSDPIVAIAGATGAVGAVMRQVLEEREFPLSRLRLLASARSAGKRLPFRGGEIEVEELEPGSFVGVDIALFSAGGDVSREFVPHAVDSGAIVVDNSSAFRMEPGVPLVVPEVNAADVAGHNGIVANPNCSTIQMVVALAPLATLSPIRRVVVSTYQAASGAGQPAMDELVEQTRAVLAGEPYPPDKFAHTIAFNVIPQIDVFLDDGSTKEEWKMVVETQKIMHAPDLAVTATCIRVPVLRAHSEAVWVEFESPVTLDAARLALAAAPGVVVEDDPAAGFYPMPLEATDTDDVYVGRLRDDPTVPNGLAMWVVADQLRKGAATNAVQIAELLLG
jgi:aspartate-semialdehyde dehydrogenase